MESDEKVCPRCAETVKAAALVCKHCQHEFAPPVKATEASPSSKQSQRVTPGKKKHPVFLGCLAIFGIITILAIIGSNLGPPSPTSQIAPDASSTPTSAGTQNAPA